MFVRPLGFACAIALLLGCTGSTSARPFAGTYDLLRIDGKPEPQPLYPGTSSPEIVGGMLTVASDTLRVSLSMQAVDSAGRVIGDIGPAVYAIPYTRHGDELVTSNGNSLVNASPLLLPGSQAIAGSVVGNDVQLDLGVGTQSFIGIYSYAEHELLFAPEP